MRATIVHESRGRMRLRLRQKTMTLRQADLLETWLKGQPWTKEAVVHERTGCVIVTYAGERETVLAAVGGFTWAGAEKAVALPSHSTRELNREFQEKLVGKVLMKGAAALFLPAPLRVVRVVWHMLPFLHKGLLLLCEEKDALREEYGVLHCTPAQLAELDPGAFLGRRETPYGVEALVRREAF